jgi:hypothetical protein
MLDTLDSLSWPGSPERANEDAFGAAGRWAWVIDASIVPGAAPVLHPSSDAEWFAAFASARFAALAPAASAGPALARQVMAEARAVFLAGAPARRDPLLWPVAALTLVRADADRLEVWTLADTAAYVRTSDGAVSCIGLASALRERESAQARRLLQATGVSSSEIVRTPAFREWLQEQRRLLNAPDGLAVFGLEPDAADRLDHAVVTCRGLAHILLASDGFSALVELYKHMETTALIDAALASGLEPLARELRRIETEIDPDGALFPRFKRSDDATALLLRKAP